MVVTNNLECLSITGKGKPAKNEVAVEREIHDNFTPSNRAIASDPH